MASKIPEVSPVPESVFAVAATPLLTTEDLLALPEDAGVERYLIDGQLRELRGNDVTVRNRLHGELTANVSYIIKQWITSKPSSTGKVYSGEVGVILARNPDTTVGVDVAYFDEATVAKQTDESSMIVGVPVLAVEILSPSDTVGAVREKVGKYLQCGVKFVWTVDPYERTVRVYQPDSQAQTLDEASEFCGDPQLPGLRVKISELFS